MSKIVAIDGPAGSGKGTIASIISKKCNLVNIDTGATYRCVALATIKNNLTLKDVDKIIELSSKIKIEFTNDIGNFKEMQDGKVAVINDYDPKYIKDFIDTVKRKINFVYINQAASIGVNLDPIFNIQ